MKEENYEIKPLKIHMAYTKCKPFVDGTHEIFVTKKELLDNFFVFISPFSGQYSKILMTLQPGTC